MKSHAPEDRPCRVPTTPISVSTAGSPGARDCATRKAKSLFASPVGAGAKDNIRRIVERFGHESFDFVLLVYDGTSYDESCFARCSIIHDEAPLFWQLKRHLTPELCRRYEYVFVWMDDLDVMEFDPQNFLQIMRDHKIQMAQPALSHQSVISHHIVAHQNNRIGRFTDFVEQMALVFQEGAWERFRTMILPDANPWGWGYDEFAYSWCGFRRLAIIDAEVIRHLHAGAYHEAAMAEHRKMRAQLRRFHFSRKMTLCTISDSPWRKHVAIPVRLLLHRLYVDLYALRPVFFIRRLIRACSGRAPAATPGELRQPNSLPIRNGTDDRHS